MNKIKLSKGCFVPALIAVVALWTASLFTAPVFAGQSPSPDSCNEMDMLDVECFVC